MLPIGSIVYLREGTKKIMILNRGPLVVLENETKIFDYSGCVYPVGLVQDEVLYFNQENIDQVLFEGFSDEAEERFQILYQEWKEKSATNLNKGIVTKPIQ